MPAWWSPGAAAPGLAFLGTTHRPGHAAVGAPRRACRSPFVEFGATLGRTWPQRVPRNAKSPWGSRASACPCDRARFRPNAHSTPRGSRTPVLGLRTRCPRPLDDGGVTLRGPAELHFVPVAPIAVNPLRGNASPSISATPWGWVHRVSPDSSSWRNRGTDAFGHRACRGWVAGVRWSPPISRSALGS